MLFHLANSPLECLISLRQVLTSSFESNKAVQIQNNASLIYNYIEDKEICHAFIHKNGAKIWFPCEQSSPRSSDSALGCSTTKLQRILWRAGQAISASQCNTRLGYSRSVRMHYRQQTKHSGENNNIVTNKWLMSPGVRRRVRRRRENKVNGARSFTSDCKGNIKTLDMRHYNTFEGSVDAKGQCVENYYWISLLNKIMINLKESLFFQPNSV